MIRSVRLCSLVISPVSSLYVRRGGETGEIF